MIRVLFICDNVKNPISMMFKVKNVLTEFKPGSVDLAVAYQCLENECAPFKKEGLSYFPMRESIGLGSIGGVWDNAKRELLKIVDDFSPDIIQCFGTEFPYGLIAKETAVPVVVHILGFLNIYYPMLDMVLWHTAQDKDNSARKDEATLWDAMTSFEREVMKANRYFMGRTDWDRNIVRYYSPGSRYYHVPEPLAPLFCKAAGTWRYHFGGRLRLVTTSSADDRKGNEIILMTAKLLKELLNLKFVWRVAGSTEFFDRYEKRSGIRHEDVGIELIGKISEQQILNELRDADLFIHPSVIDNSPNAICEAQLVGCPVIASCVGGVPQLIKDKKTGFLYPYAEPHALAFLIGNVYKNSALLARVSRAQVKSAKKRHNPKKIADETIRVYRGIISDSKKPKKSASKRKRPYTERIKKWLLIARQDGVTDALSLFRMRKSILHTYRYWMEKPIYSKKELALQRLKSGGERIVFSLIVPLFNTPEQFLREMIDSVIAQTYDYWELCLCDGSDSAHGYVESICTSYARADCRVKYKKLKENLGISGNSNKCLELAFGDYIALLDHDDVLHPAALYEVMRVIIRDGADLVYTDEAVFESPDIRNVLHIHFKPDFAPDNLRANNYLCHFTVFRRSLLKQTGGFRSEFDGAQDHDLMLRIAGVTDRISHIPMVLYYWRASPSSSANDAENKAYAYEAGKNAVAESLRATGLEGNVKRSIFHGYYITTYKIHEEPLVSIIIQGNLSELGQCLSSIEKSTYKKREVIVMESSGGSTDRPGVKVCSWSGKQNQSAMYNAAVRGEALGQYILLLSGSLCVTECKWIEEMLMYAQRPDVGAVGAMLMSQSDGTIESAGVILGLCGCAGNAFSGFLRDSYGYCGRLQYAQNLSAVSGECMMIRRDVWEKVGGMDEGYESRYADTDLCMRIRKEGYLMVWTPWAQLCRIDEKTRWKDSKRHRKSIFKKDEARFRKCWSEQLSKGDPYYNPNLTLCQSGFSPSPGNSRRFLSSYKEK